jgi:hypothetical protein
LSQAFPERRIDRMSWRTAFLAATTAAATTVLASCGGKLGAPAPDRPTSLRLRFEPGQVVEYRSELRGVQVFGTGPTPSGVTAEAVTDVTHRVVSVEPDGSATIEVDLDPVSASTNGRQTQLGSNPEPWRIVVAPQGAILDSTRPITLEADADPAGGPRVQANPSGAINPFPLLAAQPVGPGAGWSGGGQAPSPFGGGTVPLRLRSRVAGYEVVAGMPAAMIEGSVVMTLDVTVPADEYLEGTGQTAFAAELPDDAAIDYDGELRYVQRVWLQPDRGQVLRSEIAGTFVTDVEWTGVPADREGFDPVHVEGRLEVTTERTG